MEKWTADTAAIAKAAQISPALRVLAKKDDIFPIVTFNADFDGTQMEVNLSSLDACIKSLRDVKEQLPEAGKITINDIGSFTIAYPTTPVKKPRLEGRVAVITGGAQGFGEGIARELAAVGATVVIADLNGALAQTVADSLCAAYGDHAAIAVPVDVGNEESAANFMDTVSLKLGGFDLLVSNAGVLRAGGLEEMTLQNFEFVTRINYTAFFLITKYGARVLRIGAMADPAYTSDIVQINSKSGLEGSNKNFAYAGGKFGGIGLVQSFAKELVTDRVKVNAICPGNYYEGPLWSDPEKGLFVQYLNAGKVPGAQTVEDVYNSYVSKVPMLRGCSPLDVSRAILYCVEQQYETGQAIPVTGGQNMLK